MIGRLTSHVKRGAPDLAFPFCRARRAEEDEVLETKEGFGLSVANLLWSRPSCV